ncbi:phosphoribosyltransferase [Dactylosporangium aurantiacum]|uniref:Phosphoribosyltransferase n=1 Tax=Dactylosporangium aurantiacum TaxID=35754 RepID=A0A9Q9IFT4_9ACTN|nr:phosphoribosyltransferase family protein [Dactylosporangium aurantiacum]MDG6101293.1 phosphoribosyltransferase family protein [Dactylosporangium aurantiacum]UWZ54696.1 phosphoribosyltransferase [Dactylosporangium aurantiacum]
MAFRDRQEAGAALAELLTGYADRPDVIALGLVRGGMPVAAEVATRLHVPLDALVVRKLGVPWAPEVAFGAIGPGGVQVLNPEIRLEPHEMDPVIRHETTELRRRDRLFRIGRDPLDLTGRVALIVDDGLATGATAGAAIAVARALRAARVVLAAPVGATQAVDRLSLTADEVVCPVTSDYFGAVSRYYDDFRQIPDAEVTRLLSRCRR